MQNNLILVQKILELNNSCVLLGDYWYVLSSFQKKTDVFDRSSYLKFYVNYKISKLLLKYL